MFDVPCLIFDVRYPMSNVQHLMSDVQHVRRPMFDVPCLMSNVHCPMSHILGCPKMTLLLKCQAPWAFSGAKILVILEIGHKIEID